MDRNTVIGLLLIAAILIGYSLITRPSRKQFEEEARRKRDSIEQLQRAVEEQAEQTVQVPQEETLIEPEIEEEKGDTIGPEQLKDLFGAFADGAYGEKKYITIENDLLILVLSTQGGRPYSVELKKYSTHDGHPLVLFDGDSTNFGLNFFAQNRSINTNELYFTPSVDQDYINVSNEPVSVSMRLKAGENKYIEYVYTIQPGGYMIGFDIRFIHVNDILAQNTTYLDLNWEIYVSGHEKGRINENNYTTIFYKHYQDEVDKINPRSKKEIQEADIPTRIKWIAFKQQFFSSVLIAEDYLSNAYIRSTKLDDADAYLKHFFTQIGIQYQPEDQYVTSFTFYFGPNHYQTLKDYENDLEKLINLGGLFSRFFSQYLVIPVFNFLNRFIGSYGLIILLLTIVIKVILFPLTFRSYLSMAKMKVLKPEIDAINERIPKEKSMERQQATMALYKKAGVSPLGGCLPVVLQMPILIAMFRFFPSSIELRQQQFLWAHDLSTYDSILDLPFNIPMYGDHVSLFTLLMTASTILTMKISNQASASSTQMPGMKGMMYIMPIMFMFILNNFSAALTYYYFLANLITFGQNMITKQFVDENAILKKLEENKKKPVKKSKWQQRLENAAKQRGVQPKRK